MASLISRAGWGAKPPTGEYTRLARAKGTKVHYTGGRVDPAIVDDHRICLQLMLQFQRHHMAGNGWSDFAYNLAACPHRRLIVGRGFGVMSAANGPGNNTGHYAILALLGNSGFDRPNDELLHALRDGIELLRKNGAGPEIKGHRDGYATDCPGGPLYAWVRAGAPRPDAITPPPSSTPWTEALVDALPTLDPGDEHKHVKTMRCLLFARGYEPINLYSTKYGHNAEDLADLKAQVNAFKAKHKLPQDGIWGDRCWQAALA